MWVIQGRLVDRANSWPVVQNLAALGRFCAIIDGGSKKFGFWEPGYYYYYYYYYYY